MNIRALIFDLYGTLVVRQERQFLREISKYYIPPSDDEARLSKLGAFGLELMKQLMVTDLSTHELPEDVVTMFPHMATESLDDLRGNFRKALKMEARATKLIPGVKTILAFFRQREYKIGIVSNASTLHKQPLVDFDLERFVDASIFSCDIGHAKPEPAIYLIACQRLNVAPETVVFVGDSYHMDVKVPLELGMQAIHVSKAQRHQRRIAHITDIGLWSLEPELFAFQDVLNATLELRERQISLNSYTLFPRHPDREWITYLCSGSRDGQPQDFWLQRAVHGNSSGFSPGSSSESIQLPISGEVFRLSPA